jgi:hypothetical protein
MKLKRLIFLIFLLCVLYLAHSAASILGAKSGGIEFHMPKNTHEVHFHLALRKTIMQKNS